MKPTKVTLDVIRGRQTSILETSEEVKSNARTGFRNLSREDQMAILNLRISRRTNQSMSKAYLVMEAVRLKVLKTRAAASLSVEVLQAKYERALEKRIESFGLNPFTTINSLF